MNALPPDREALLLVAVEQLAAARDVVEVARLVSTLGRRAIGCSGVRLVSWQAERIVTLADDGSASLGPDTAEPYEAGLVALAMRRHNTVVVQDVQASDLVPPGADAVASLRGLAVAPLGADRFDGALLAYWDHPGAASPGRIDALEAMARSVGRALGTARMLDALPHLIWVRERDGRITRIGRQWSDYRPHPSDTASDDPAATPYPHDPEDAGTAWVAGFASAAPFEFEHCLQRLDGARTWFKTRAVPIHDADGQVLQWLGTSTDIDALVQERRAATEAHDAIRRRLQDEMDGRGSTEARLAKAERIEAVGQLTSGVAHDFNNLLTVIIGNIEFLEEARDTGLDTRARARLAAIREAAERGGDLTRQLLAFARRQRLDPISTDLNGIVTELRGLLPAAVGGGLGVETGLAPDLWPALVDRTEIVRVILNLAHNAHDAMDVGGTIQVATRNRHVAGPREATEAGLTGPGDYVEVSVADRGRGMTPDVLAHAFEPFFTTKPPGKGSGLGLAQVYGFARQSGGVVTIRSAPGEGTTVSILLPRAAAHAEPAVIAAPIARAPAFPTIPPVPALAPLLGLGQIEPKRLVLLVDDDSAVREVTSTIVAEAGYRVVEAASGADALARMGSIGPIDLMVTDYAMPGMNGFELSCEARTRQPGLKVLFVTGYADLTALGDVTENRILLKPFRGARLLDKIAGALAD